MGFKKGHPLYYTAKPCQDGCQCGKHSRNETPEAIAKRVEAARQVCLGRIPWNKGKPMKNDMKERISNTLKGCPAPPTAFKKGSVPWNKNLTKGKDERVAKSAETRNQRILLGEISSGGRANPSQLAWTAYEKFLQDFEIVIPEERFGPYTVDFLLAEEWLAIEADGSYWHELDERRNPGCFERRDKYLLDKFRLPTIRLSEPEIDNIENLR